MAVNKQLIEQALKRKEKYLSENEEYRRNEALMHRHTAGKYIGDMVYGANDGIITTFAIVAGAQGAALAPVIIIILGLANIVADGISMGASSFLGSRSEKDFAKAQRQREDWEIDHLRELEVEEIREIFEKKGFRGRNLGEAVSVITSNRQVWLDTMMRDELGILEDPKDDPKKHGLVTFIAFIFAGFFPLFSYLIPGIPNPFIVSVVVGCLTLFAVGASRSLITTAGWFSGGMTMLVVGSAAAAIAYFVGYLGNLVVGAVQ